jgi:hypothetical protein
MNLSVIPSEVEGSRFESVQVTHRDSSTALRTVRNDEQLK